MGNVFDPSILIESHMLEESSNQNIASKLTITNQIY